MRKWPLLDSQADSHLNPMEKCCDDYESTSRGLVLAIIEKIIKKSRKVYLVSDSINFRLLLVLTVEKL